MESHKLFDELRTSKSKIIWMLEKYPKTRDDDNMLYVGYVVHEMGQGNKELGRSKLEKMSAMDFLTDVSFHAFINFATLIRCRRLIQADENYKHLRGTKWSERAEADELFRQNINKL